MLYVTVIAVYSEIHKTHKCTVNAKLGGICICKNS